jgi:cyclopropane fatty-acyl-phospholipid synthase-like methyltransferase
MQSTDREYFHTMYAGADDPWSFATSPYELRKYTLTVDTLPRERYRNVFEPGCSVGVLSEKLAPHCDRLLATDIVTAALDQATERLGRWNNVVVERRAIPESWPDEMFDLIVLSELAYYFDSETLHEVMDLITCSTKPGAHVVAVHWRGETNYPLSGDEAHALIGQTRRLRNVVHHLEEAFVLDLWERVA